VLSAADPGGGRERPAEGEAAVIRYVDGQRVGERVLTRERLQLRGRRAARVQADVDYTAALTRFRCPLHGRQGGHTRPAADPPEVDLPFPDELPIIRLFVTIEGKEGQP